MRETHDNNSKILFLYDQVYTREQKAKQMDAAYGFEIRRAEEYASSSEYHRAFGKEFAKSQMMRSRPKSRRAKSRAGGSGGEGYIYRPQGVPNGGRRASAAAAATTKTTPLKLVMEKIVNLFETIEERGRNDERIAKQRAIMSKKWSDNKHNILTALLLVLITVLVFTVIYKVCFVIKTVDVYGAQSYSEEEVAGATGINLGDNLYSFKSSDVESEITFKCPYIKSADVTRSIPETVNVVIEEDTPIYYANVWGDYLTLSSTLRVLGTMSTEEAESTSLIKIIIPEVKKSVAGRALEFADSKSEKLVKTVLDTVSNSTAGKSGEITEINLTDEYNITMTAENIYSLKLGGGSDLDLKLRMLHKTITSGGLENGAPATIDLSKVGEASVKYDLN